MSESPHSHSPEAPATEPLTTEPLYVKMYYEHQYEALARVSNYGIWVTLTTLSLSVLVALFAFDGDGRSHIVVWLGAPLLMVAGNGFAIIFLRQVRMRGGQMHIQRAKAVLQRYAPDLLDLEQTARHRSDTPRRPWARIIPSAPRAQLLLHGCLALFFLLAPLIYFLS